MYNTAAILNEGMTCLVDTTQIIREPFDYTEWQRKHYANFSVAELNKLAVEYAKGN